MAFWSPEFWARDFGASASLPRRGGASDRGRVRAAMHRCRNGLSVLSHPKTEGTMDVAVATRLVATRRPSPWRCLCSWVARHQSADRRPRSDTTPTVDVAGRSHDGGGAGRCTSKSAHSRSSAPTAGVLARAAHAELEKASSHLNWPTGATPPYESRKRATPLLPYESSIR